MSDPLRHLAIAASAGTGKTYQLAHRFLRLVLRGEAPERIVALTFSRKAAREIFERVVGYLAEAARDEAGAAARNRALGGDAAFSPADYRNALRRLLTTLPRSRVGTIDSFLVGVVRAFPYELGLEPDFEVFDGDGVEGRRARAEAMHSVLSSVATRRDARAQFFEAFKRASFGVEEKRSIHVLTSWIKDFQKTYRLQPDARAWQLAVDAGRPSCPDRASWLDLIDSFATAMREQGWKKFTATCWDEWCAELAVWEPGDPPGKRMKYLLPRLEPHLAMLGVAPVSLTMNRDESMLAPAHGDMVRRILAFIGDEVLRLASIRTLGLHAIISRFEAVYDAEIRRRGRLTFEDALFALCGHTLASAPGAGRLHIDFRLDGRLDHWLIDEFQDTSTQQWEVLANLIDEVIQDVDQRRSFFYVGDVKQAIYGWRDGNADLFGRILDRYNRNGSAVIATQPLDTSFRSCAAVIDTVNRIFGLLPGRVNPGAARRWSALWHPHACATSVPPSGCAALLALPKGAWKDEDDEASGYEPRHLAAADLLGAIDPPSRGLTAAVLCRSNSNARLLAETIRARYPDLPVVLEGDSRITDNPAVSLLLSLLTWAEHPGDWFARRHLEMSPLRDALADPVAVLAEVQARGFRTALHRWSEHLEQRVALTAYERMRVGQLLDQAALADALPDRTIDRFVAGVREVTVEETPNRLAVRVMTIHKSKGLAFDLVVMPDLQGGGGGPDSGPIIQWPEDRSRPTWLVQRMPGGFAGLIPPVASCLEAEAERGAFEDLCVLYVAMTRAARGLYLIVDEPSEKSVAVNDANLLFDALSRAAGETSGGVLEVPLGRTVYLEGDAAWYTSIPQQTRAVDDEADMPSDEAIPLLLGHPADDRGVPSAGGEFERDAVRVFDPTLRQRRELGTQVHAVFQQVAWLEEGASLLDNLDPATPAAVRDQVARGDASPEVRAVFTRPPDEVSLWREQPFEIMLDGSWVSGVFDRVVLHQDAEGRLVRAGIIDFKTNRVDDPARLDELAAHYRDQMDTYRAAACRLLDLPAARIGLTLVFTDAGRVVPLE
jgi:ATP-dependent helicase/nuclease subunit A